MTYRSIKSLTESQLNLLREIESLPKEFRDFCYDLLMDDRERLEFGGKLLVYGTSVARWLAVLNFVERFNGTSIKDLAKENQCTIPALTKRLDKLRDAFVISLTGGLTTRHRGQASILMKKAGWHEEDLCAVLRNSHARLQAYEAWAGRVSRRP